MPRKITHTDQELHQIYKFRDENNLLDILSDTMHKVRDHSGIYKPLRFFEIIPNSIWRKAGNAPSDLYGVAEALTDAGDFIKINRKTPVGALFEADRSYGDTYIPVQLLWEIEKHRVLNPAQMHELERLLNLAGQSLGIQMPAIPTLTDDDFREIMMTVARDIMLSKPRIARDAYLNHLNIKGVPMKVTEAEFKEAAKKYLTP